MKSPAHRSTSTLTPLVDPVGRSCGHSGSTVAITGNG
jgi:hypothetical protein